MNRQSRSYCQVQPRWWTSLSFCLDIVISFNPVVVAPLASAKRRLQYNSAVTGTFTTIDIATTAQYSLLLLQVVLLCSSAVAIQSMLLRTTTPYSIFVATARLLQLCSSGWFGGVGSSEKLWVYLQTTVAVPVFDVLPATMASGDVDLCLVPESPIVLEGPTGCIPHLMKRVRPQNKLHARLLYIVLICCYLLCFSLFLLRCLFEMPSAHVGMTYE